MARFEMFVPEEIEKQLDKLYNDTPKIFGAMTKAGAQIVADELKATAPHPDIAAEYGRSNLPFPRKPFLRKAFDPRRIEKVMKDKQREMTGGLLNE